MITLKRGTFSERKTVPTGFSWTTFFFGIFPALFRGDRIGVVFMFVSGMLTLGFSWLAWPFFYNANYISRLKSDGWVEDYGFGQDGSSGGNSNSGSSKKVPHYHEEVRPSGAREMDYAKWEILKPEPVHKPASPSRPENNGAQQSVFPTRPQFGRKPI
jgi:hypothetical protein